jgi:GT2 family glycosyltransferase
MSRLHPSAGLQNFKASVVIVSWNAEQFLERCLLSLMTQTVVPYEIILVDNASADASLKIAKAFDSIRIFPQATNIGFAKANNFAIKHASPEADWIALINPDAFAEPTWLESLQHVASSHPQFDVFGSRLLDATNPLQLDGGGDAYHVSGLVWRLGHGAVVPAVDDVDEIFSPCAAAAMYRRSALQAVGGFDEDYFCYVEDVDLGFRLRLAGYRCLHVPSSVVHHVGSGTTGGKNSEFAMYHGHRNLVWTYVKNMPGVLFWLLLPAHIALNVLCLLAFSVRGQGRVTFRAKWDAIVGLPKMWRKRRDIQRTRVVPISAIWAMLDKTVFRRKR